MQTLAVVAAMAGLLATSVAPMIRLVDETTGLTYGRPAIRHIELEDPARTWLEGRIRGNYRTFRVSLTKHGDATPLKTVECGEGNQFEFDGAPPGNYRLRAFTTSFHQNFADFVIESVEVKAGHMTEILDGLNMQPCLMGFKCPSVTKTWQEPRNPVRR